MGSNKNDMLNFQKLLNQRLISSLWIMALILPLKLKLRGRGPPINVRMVFWCFIPLCILDQPKLRYPFTNFFREVLKCNRLSLGQLCDTSGFPALLYCTLPLMWNYINFWIND
ncbi:hypothetical protein Hanom_Chr07g00612711 [Helianthus anomalus]